jgi:hypothetical protein
MPYQLTLTTQGELLAQWTIVDTDTEDSSYPLAKFRPNNEGLREGER